MYDKTLNFGFNQDLNQLKDTVYKFAQNEIAPLAKKVDENNEFPNILWEKFGELGLLGITADEDYGGTGLNYLSHCIVMEEISRASASIGLSYGAFSNLFGLLSNLFDGSCEVGTCRSEGQTRMNLMDFYKFGESDGWSYSLLTENMNGIGGTTGGIGIPDIVAIISLAFLLFIFRKK